MIEVVPMTPPIRGPSPPPHFGGRFKSKKVQEYTPSGALGLSRAGWRKAR